MPLPKAENDDDSHSEIKEAPKSSSVTYFAEGDKLYRKNEFRKAIESYTAVGKQLHLFPQMNQPKMLFSSPPLIFIFSVFWVTKSYLKNFWWF